MRRVKRHLPARDDAGRRRRLAVSVLAAVAALLLAGCPPPVSECSSDADCASHEACLPISQRPPDPVVDVTGPDLAAPTSTSNVEAEDEMTVTATKRALLVDDRKVTDLPLDESLMGENELTISPLKEELETVIEQKKQEMELLGKSFDPSATLVIDRSLPTSLATYIVATSVEAGLRNYELGIRRSPSDGPWPSSTR